MKENRGKMTQILALLTLTAFALCLLLVLLMGASAYEALVDQAEVAYHRRTALQYVTTRVRQAESVKIGVLEDCEALILEETIEGEVYTTHIYCHEGWLRELYAVPGAKLPPQAGEALLELKQFSLEQEGKLLRVMLEDTQLLLQLPSGKQVGP